MTKNQTSVHAIVGAFIVFGFGCMLYLAFQVSGLATDFNKKTYQLQAEFSNVGGLNEYARISIAGVTVGRVQSITLNPETLNAMVTMDIDASTPPLTTDTSARILTSGLLGEKYIGLLPGSDEEFLEDGDMLEDTQGALVLEDLVSRFLVNSND